MSSNQPKFTVLGVSATFVWIRDEDVGRSVTNGAGNVVKRLHQSHPGLRIIYRDTDGNWDELKHDGKGQFNNFCSARANPFARVSKRFDGTFMVWAINVQTRFTFSHREPAEAYADRLNRGLELPSFQLD